jgi:hypothetical protein
LAWTLPPVKKSSIIRADLLPALWEFISGMTLPTKSARLSLDLWASHVEALVGENVVFLEAAE